MIIKSIKEIQLFNDHFRESLPAERFMEIKFFSFGLDNTTFGKEGSTLNPKL